MAEQLSRAQVLGAFPELWDDEVDGEPEPTKNELRCDRAEKALLAAGLTPDEIEEVSTPYAEGSRSLAERLEEGLKALRAKPAQSAPTDAGAVGLAPARTPRRRAVPSLGIALRPKRRRRVA
jgi:hypothetical protein